MRRLFLLLIITAAFCASAGAGKEPPLPPLKGLEKYGCTIESQSIQVFSAKDKKMETHAEFRLTFWGKYKDGKPPDWKAVSKNSYWDEEGDKQAEEDCRAWRKRVAASLKEK